MATLCLRVQKHLLAQVCAVKALQQHHHLRRRHSLLLLLHHRLIQQIL